MEIWLEPYLVIGVLLASHRTKGPRGAWLNDNNGYIGDVSPMVGAEITYLILQVIQLLSDLW